MRNSGPLSEFTPATANGSASAISPSRPTTASAPLFQVQRISTHCVATSASVSVQQNDPAMLPPQCATVSTSTQPAREVASPGQTSTFSGTSLRCSERLDARRLPPMRGFAPRRRRSIVEVLMPRTAAAVSSGMSAPSFLRQSIHTPRTGRRSFPQGRSASFHIRTSRFLAATSALNGRPRLR